VIQLLQLFQRLDPRVVGAGLRRDSSACALPNFFSPMRGGGERFQKILLAGPADHSAARAAAHRGTVGASPLLGEALRPAARGHSPARFGGNASNQRTPSRSRSSGGSRHAPATERCRRRETRSAALRRRRATVDLVDDGDASRRSALSPATTASRSALPDP
jgi:hypothetical protein